MNENELTRRLGLLTDDPVEPPDDLRRDLWHRIESQLRNPQVTPAQDQRGDPSDDGEIIGRPCAGRRRRLPGPVAAAAAFLAVIAVGILVWWLRPADSREQVVDTTTSPTATSVEEESTGLRQIAIGADGAMAFPDDLFPSNIADAGGLVVVIAERSPHEEGTPPQEEAAILAIDPGSGQIRWRRDLDGGPSFVETSEDAAWVAHFPTGAVTKLDLSPR